MKTLVALIALAMCFVSTDTSTVDAQRRKRRTVVQARTQKLVVEGEALGRKLVDKFLTRCGESYFAKYGSEIREWKGVKVTFAHSSPSPANKLNGVAWVTDMKITFDAQRTVGEQSWENGADIYSFRIIKKDGSWQPHYFLPYVGEELFGPLESDHKLVCSEILPRVVAKEPQVH